MVQIIWMALLRKIGCLSLGMLMASVTQLVILLESWKGLWWLFVVKNCCCCCIKVGGRSKVIY